SGYHRRALLNLADQASADNPLIRPTARQFAHNIRATIPGATLTEAESDRISELPFASDDHRETGRSRSGWKSAASLKGRLSQSLTHLGSGAAAIILAVTVAYAVGADNDSPQQVTAP